MFQLSILPWLGTGLVPLSRRASLDICDVVVYSLGHFQCGMASRSYAITPEKANVLLAARSWILASQQVSLSYLLEHFYELHLDI